MKVSVCCEVLYNYEIEIPNDVDDIESYSDSCDPVYKEICETMTDVHVNFTGRLVSIVDSDTGEVYYTD